ncbi:hypothetical protein F1559_002130 [Cyanidiococcus yangmingshanensis]|uniref:Uncharacterized protein n=1 Tax=Cyanidiococcus yangmingshanensis TaxID=2690220 RepID=A0A7J7ID12_9RHOD|nr:hypothetical protein F1559_002130 [Cyanidiococcus yangmingshanensis]
MWFFVAAIHLVQNLPNFFWTVAHGRRRDPNDPDEQRGLQRPAPFYARSDMLRQDYWSSVRSQLDHDCWQFARESFLRECSTVKATPSEAGGTAAELSATSPAPRLGTSPGHR